MQKLTDLVNISKVTAGHLEKAGIPDADSLRSAGSREAFLRIRLHADSGACLSMLYGLEGAVRGVRWHELPGDVKADLKTFFRSL